MYHYVYQISFPDGMQYIGMHSTVIEPHLDTCYLGSGGKLPPRTPQSSTKTILGIFPTRELALQYEIAKIIEFDAVKSKQFYNMRVSCHDKHGSKLSLEHRELISKTHKGRERVEYGKKYTGEGRTPAQKAGDKRAALKLLGTKNPAKGKPGITNQGFTPWYYITPEGEYVEVHDQTRQDKAHEFGLTPRQLTHGFHYTNEHKKAEFPPRKGWTFGSLPRPTESDEE